MQILKDKELEDAFSEVSKLCKLVLTILATSFTVENAIFQHLNIKFFCDQFNVAGDTSSNINFSKIYLGVHVFSMTLLTNSQCYRKITLQYK